MTNKKDILEVLEYKYKQKLNDERKIYFNKKSQIQKNINLEYEKINKIILTNDLNQILDNKIYLKFEQNKYSNNYFCNCFNDYINENLQKLNDLDKDFTKIKEYYTTKYENLVNEIKLFGINKELLELIKKF